MKEIMRQDDIQFVESRIRKFEEATGCELLLVMARSSDEYPGASWRFGIISGFIFTFIFSLFFDFHIGYLWPLTMMLITLFMVWVGHFPAAKRFAMSDIETQRECLEKSIEYFHSLGTSRVSHKVTAMIMVSVLEKKIMVLVDEKLKSQISQPELDELVQIMKIHFTKGEMGLGFIQSIDSLEQKILKDFGGKVSNINASELSDKIHFL